MTPFLGITALCGSTDYSCPDFDLYLLSAQGGGRGKHLGTWRAEESAPLPTDTWAENALRQLEGAADVLEARRYIAEVLPSGAKVFSKIKMLVNVQGVTYTGHLEEAIIREADGTGKGGAALADVLTIMGNAHSKQLDVINTLVGSVKDMVVAGTTTMHQLGVETVRQVGLVGQEVTKGNSTMHAQHLDYLKAKDTAAMALAERTTHDAITLAQRTLSPVDAEAHPGLALLGDLAKPFISAAAPTVVAKVVGGERDRVKKDSLKPAELPPHDKPALPPVPAAFAETVGPYLALINSHEDTIAELNRALRKQAEMYDRLCKRADSLEGRIATLENASKPPSADGATPGNPPVDASPQGPF